MGVEALTGKSEEVVCAGNQNRVTAAENLAKKQLSEMKDFSKSGNGFPEVGLHVKAQFLQMENDCTCALWMAAWKVLLVHVRATRTKIAT